MYDRPAAAELLDAARTHLERNVIPVIKHDRRLYFQTLVAINVLHIVERELALGAGHRQAEWSRLNALEGTVAPLPPDPSEAQAALAGRNRQLCADIRTGQYDEAARRAALFEHLLATTREQLTVANPKFLARLAAEEEASASA